MVCPNPITVRKGTPSETQVPCGKCYYCKQNYRNMWITRLKAEFLDSSYGIFATLTYDNEHLPVMEYVDTSTGEVIFKPYPDKAGFQKFLKRLRKHYSVRYFAVSEYGEETLRPHWHVLFFLDFLPDYKFYDFLQETWKCGNVQYGTITDASITYVTKYLLKEGKVPYDLHDEKMLCSRVPPIGSVIIMKFRDYARQTENFTRLRFYGYQASTPRLFRDKFKDGIDTTDVIQESIRRRNSQLDEEFKNSKFTNFQDFLVWKLETESKNRLKNHKKHNKL